MNKIYFNHQRIIGSPNKSIDSFVSEIAIIKNTLGPITLYIYSKFWEIPIQSGKLRTYFNNNDNRAQAYITILTLMNSGPFYFFSNSIPDLITNPELPLDSFAAELMHICFHDTQPTVVSLKDEKILVNAEYILTGGGKTLKVINLSGKEGVAQYFEKNLSFDSIEAIFKEIERSHPDIVILDSAKKSARKHSFKRALPDIFKTICALEAEMESLIANVPDIKRQELFMQKTGFEISGESPSLLNTEKYAKCRRFEIPAKSETALFEWHIKIGDETRIHYYIDKAEKRIYLGHCGKHLPVPSYHS